MFKLHIDTETKREFDLDKDIHSAEFDDFDMFAVYVMAELDASDEKVYILSYGGDEDGVVFIDHSTSNIVDNILTQCKMYYDTHVMCDVFLFAESNYNDAYELATDMKESTGMLDFQLKDEETPTVKNGGIEVTSLKN